MAVQIRGVVTPNGEPLDVMYLWPGMPQTNTNFTAAATSMIDLTGNDGGHFVYTISASADFSFRIDEGNAGTITLATACIHRQLGQPFTFQVQGPATADVTKHKWLLFIGQTGSGTLISIRRN